MLGKHIIAELHGVNPEILDDFELLKKVLLEAAINAGAIVIGDIFHKFSPHGVMGIVALGGWGHYISIHTWPEFGYAALDMFICGNMDPCTALNKILERLNPKHYMVMQLSRGEPYTEEIRGEGKISQHNIKISVKDTDVSEDKNKDFE